MCKPILGMNSKEDINIFVHALEIGMNQIIRDTDERIYITAFNDGDSIITVRVGHYARKYHLSDLSGMIAELSVMVGTIFK